MATIGKTTIFCSFGEKLATVSSRPDLEVRRRASGPPEIILKRRGLVVGLDQSKSTVSKMIEDRSHIEVGNLAGPYLASTDVGAVEDPILCGGNDGKL